MPTPAQTIKVINFNRKNKTGKHYTADEIKRRAAAAEKLKRPAVRMKVPAFLKEVPCAAALKIFKELVKEGSELELFDNVDARVLANYSRYQALFEEEASRMFPNQKKLDSYGKQALSYAERLGLTPTARARLVVKKANAATEPTEAEKLRESMMA